MLSNNALLSITSDRLTDINLPLKLRKVYGHINMGVYLIPLNDGIINIDNEVKLIL